MEAVMIFLKGIVEQYNSMLPASVIAVILIVGSARILIKPAMALFKAVTEVTPSKKDDELYAKVEKSKALKAVIFGLDWLMSIKWPEPKKVEAPQAEAKK